MRIVTVVSLQHDTGALPTGVSITVLLTLGLLAGLTVGTTTVTQLVKHSRCQSESDKKERKVGLKQRTVSYHECMHELEDKRA